MGRGRRGGITRLPTTHNFIIFTFPAARVMLHAMRIPAACILALLAAIPVDAKPRVADWKWWAHNTVNVGVSLVTTYTINRCMRDHGLGVCVGGDYGPFAAKEAVRNSISLSSFWSSYEWKKREGRTQRFWYLIPDANAVFNSVVILRNHERSFSPREPRESSTKLTLDSSHR